MTMTGHGGKEEDLTLDRGAGWRCVRNVNFGKDTALALGSITCEDSQ